MATEEDEYTVAALANLAPSPPSRRHRIALVSDFFFPKFGGVENHIYALAQALLARGHKVIVITHSYGDRKGVRYVTGGLKVYYVPFLPFYQQSIFPTLYAFFPLFRQIMIREDIEIVHGHQAFSTLCHESLLHARTMGLQAVFTDHSLFGFADASSILMNKVLKFVLSDVGHVICVSHTSKENTVLRAALSPESVSVIPNAIDTNAFLPSTGPRATDTINIVVISRLVYRKGVDLLVECIPEICHRFPNVNFIIGGDGDKRLALEEMREKHQLHDRIELLGAVPHTSVRDVLVRGHIFLNCSLTEAFCIAILEAVSAGLLCVSTRVGGVPEVLPPHLISLADPIPADLVRAVSEIIPKVKDTDPAKLHAEVQGMYSWDNVAQRTEVVYDTITEQPKLPLVERLRRYYGTGLWAGKLFTCIIACDYLLYQVLQWAVPDDWIDRAIDFPQNQYKRLRKEWANKKHK